MNMESILIIVGIVILLGVAGAALFAAFKVKQILDSFDAKVTPALDNLKATTESLKPAIAQADNLMAKVNITLDSLDIELMKVDNQLANIAVLTGKVTEVSEAVPQVAERAKDAVKDTVKTHLFKRG